MIFPSWWALEGSTGDYYHAQGPADNYSGMRADADGGRDRGFTLGAVYMRLMPRAIIYTPRCGLLTTAGC